MTVSGKISQRRKEDSQSWESLEVTKITNRLLSVVCTVFGWQHNPFKASGAFSYFTKAKEGNTTLLHLPAARGLLLPMSCTWKVEPRLQPSAGFLLANSAVRTLGSMAAVSQCLGSNQWVLRGGGGWDSSGLLGLGSQPESTVSLNSNSPGEAPNSLSFRLLQGWQRPLPVAVA